MDLNGIILVDKPEGPSSFEVVRLIRRMSKMSRVGHAGTLDPLAEGLLVVCLGEGCKLVPFLQDGIKRYKARIALGIETLTLDKEGDVIRREEVSPFSQEEVQRALARFKGRVMQVPPVYSAVKKDGVKLYRKARRGEAVQPEPREIHIDAIELDDVAADSISITVDCKKGTYIRSLARDVADALGTIGILDYLRRVSTSGFHVQSAMPLDHIAHGASIVENVISMPDALPHMPKVVIDDEKAALVRNGGAIPYPEHLPKSIQDEDPHVALLSAGGELVAIAKRMSDKLQPVRVMLK
jgi:tRNA pseudouridine55 synthase